MLPILLVYSRCQKKYSLCYSYDSNIKLYRQRVRTANSGVAIRDTTEHPALVLRHLALKPLANLRPFLVCDLSRLF